MHMVRLRYDFGQALVILKQGQRVAREGWNGKGMWIECPPPTKVQKALFEVMGDKCSTGPVFGPLIMLYTTDHHYTPWCPSQTDILSNDWVCIDVEPGVNVLSEQWRINERQKRIDEHKNKAKVGN